MACACCGRGPKVFFTGKLGHCARCIRLSGLGAAGGWIAFASLSLAPVPALFPRVSLALAVAFSALLAAHLAAFARRLTAAVAQEPAAEVRLARGTLIRLAWGGLLAFAGLAVVGRPPGALAQDKEERCRLKDQGDPPVRVCVPSTCGPLYEQNADGSFTELATRCRIVSVRKPNGDPLEDRCVCVAMKGGEVLTCKVKNEGKREGKTKLDCEQTCPTLYRPTGDARQRWAPVEGTCVLVGDYRVEKPSEPLDAIIFKCICVYGE